MTTYYKRGKDNITVKFKELTKEDYTELGKVVKTMRKNRNVSQNDLSAKTQRDRTGLSAYERGKTIPTLYALHDIAEVLEYDMELSFKEVPVLKRNIITKEYAEKFINERSNERSLSHSVFSRICALDEECHISEIKDNDITISLESGKLISIKVNDIYNDLDNFDKRRFIPISIQTTHKRDDGNIGYCVWHYKVDSKENGLDENSTKKVTEYIHDCVLLGDIFSLNDELDELLENRIDIERLKLCIFDSYHTLKMNYNLKDEEILEIVHELYGEDTNNFFIGILTSSYEPQRIFSKKRDGILKKMRELSCEYGALLGNETIYKLFCIAYCLIFENKAFYLHGEGSDFTTGSYICHYSIEPEEDDWGHQIVKPHILRLIDECFKVLSTIYSDESSFDIIEELIVKGTDYTIEYEEIEHYTEVYKEKMVINRT